MEKNYTMKKIGGYSYQKREAEKIVHFFKNFKEYTENGAILPRGIFFYGEPGNGKTLFANAIANDSGVKSYFLTDNLYLSDDSSITKELSKLFKEAIQNAPSIIILDEIDQLIECGTPFSGPSDNEKAVLRVLLTEIDKLENSGVLVIATANADIEDMPSALVRNGRIEKHVYIGNPDLEDRTNILKMFLGGSEIFKNIKPEEIAKLTQGLTCASLKALVNDVLIKCVSNNSKKATYQDFHDPLQVIVSHGIQRKTANNIDDVIYHEVGHLVADFILNGKIGFVSAESYGQTAGRYKSSIQLVMGINHQDTNEQCKTFDDFKRNNTVLMCGLAATEVFLGKKYVGAVGDLYKIKNSYEIMCSNGLLSFEDFVEIATTPKKPAYLQQEKVKIDQNNLSSYLSELYKDAVNLLKEHSELVQKLFEALKKKKTLTSGEVKEIIENM